MEELPTLGEERLIGLPGAQASEGMARRCQTIGPGRAGPGRAGPGRSFSFRSFPRLAVQGRAVPRWGRSLAGRA